MTTDTLNDSMLSGIFDLKRDVAISTLIEKRDYYSVQTAVGNTVLNSGSDLVFAHDNNQNPISIFDSVLKISGKFTKADSTTKITDANRQLIHNWGYSLFKTAMLRVNGIEVERIEDVRNATALLGHCLKSRIYCTTCGEMEGWVPDREDSSSDAAKNLGLAQRSKTFKNDSDAFELILPLENIFGFCDVRKIIYLARLELTLGRNTDDALYFLNTAIPADAEKGKIVLDDMRWLIRIITPSPSLKSSLISSLMDNSFIPFTFMRRYTYTTTLFAGAGADWIIKPTIAHPRYIILGFKSATINTIAYNVNNALYEPVGITSLRVNLNGNKYPDPAMTFDFKNGKVSDGYLAYVNFCLKNGVEPSLSLYEWSKFYTIFVFDTSNLAEQILVGSIQIQIEIKRTSVVADAVQAFGYCLLMEDENNKGFDVGQGRFLAYK